MDPLLHCARCTEFSTQCHGSFHFPFGSTQTESSSLLFLSIHRIPIFVGPRASFSHTHNNTHHFPFFRWVFRTWVSYIHVCLFGSSWWPNFFESVVQSSFLLFPNVLTLYEWNTCRSYCVCSSLTVPFIWVWQLYLRHFSLPPPRGSDHLCKEGADNTDSNCTPTTPPPPAATQRGNNVGT